MSFHFQREKFLFEQAMKLGVAKNQGIQQANEKIARNALAMNLDVEIVAKITSLSLDDVKALKENMHLF